MIGEVLVERGGRVRPGAGQLREGGIELVEVVDQRAWRQLRVAAPRALRDPSDEPVCALA